MGQADRQHLVEPSGHARPVVVTDEMARAGAFVLIDYAEISDPRAMADRGSQAMANAIAQDAGWR